MNSPKLALARQYRPRTFEEVVGQEMTLQALKNALNQQRLHHAYLLTGTRGVGKTTIARILAKCLNCERGISAEPCGQCTACTEIDAGCFPDLIEVDAASRTKVEDTRELLENVQYRPTRGRFKIYLIDEIHMLSGHSFNALLKTLEEPPLHVKFLFATTDPQKLPATILSRCLKFHLWRLPAAKIADHLKRILEAEKQAVEAEALMELAHAAEGSLRDALSLLDQALSYGESAMSVSSVRQMLGLSEKTFLLSLLKAVSSGDSARVLKEIARLAEYTPDFSGVLTELLALLHHIALAQFSKETLDLQQPESEALLALAEASSAEEIQLYYQIGIEGQRDLPYAPSLQMGFEMVLLRMVAFQPARISSFGISSEVPTQKTEGEIQPVKTVLPKSEPLRAAPSIVPNQTRSTERLTPPSRDWPTVVQALGLTGLVKLLAEHSVVSEWTEEAIHLKVDSSQKALLGNKRYEERLREALCQYLKKEVRLNITETPRLEDTPALQNQRAKAAAYESAHQQIETDQNLQSLMETFDAKIEAVTLNAQDLKKAGEDR